MQIDTAYGIFEVQKHQHYMESDFHIKIYGWSNYSPRQFVKIHYQRRTQISYIVEHHGKGEYEQKSDADIRKHIKDTFNNDYYHWSWDYHKDYKTNYNGTIKQAVMNVFGCNDKTAEIIKTKTRAFASNNKGLCRPIRVKPNYKILNKLNKKYPLPPSSSYHNKAKKFLGWRKVMKYGKFTSNAINYYDGKPYQKQKYRHQYAHYEYTEYEYAEYE